MECGYSAKVNGTMNTKTTFKCGSNFYDGENMGRDSPGALLDMLAEVASQTLHSEKEQNEVPVAIPKSKTKTDTIKKKKQELSSYSLVQLLSMPASQLIKQFTIFTSDELKRQYTYTCALVADCMQKYTSFASESRARMLIKSHLLEHLEYLKNNPHTYSSFVTTTIKCRKSKANLHKKVKNQQVKKSPENLNKENKEIKTEKCTSYLRKILSNEVNLKESENHKVQATKLQKEIHHTERFQAGLDSQFLVDHSYYEHAKNDSLDDTYSEITEQNLSGNPSETNSNNIVEENIVLMVVENDGVHVKELPYISHDFSQEMKSEESDLKNQDPVLLSGEHCNNKMVENMTSAKPKGKAKFIGTSKEEREMALALMERIKKKGNPAGNNLQCRICDPPRSFTAPTTLVSHYRSHAGIKPYECRICKAVFTRRHSLKYHMLIHQNQTRFTCADCEKKFRHPSHFREHRRRHTGEAPFGCDDCGQRFKTRNTYKRHLKTRHGKVLTTSGELLRLSEEDFQKVKTNRRKKSDYSVANETAIATNVIIQYQKCEAAKCPGHSPSDTEYCQMQDINDNGTVWVNYRDYEKSEESHINKTDFIETEVAVENDANKNIAKQHQFDDGSNGEQGAVELEHVSDNLQMIHNDILYSDNEALYGVENMNEYMNVNYSDAQFAQEDDTFVYQKDTDNTQHVQNNYCNSSSQEFNNSYSECIKNLETNSANTKNAANEQIPCKMNMITEQIIKYDEKCENVLQIDKERNTKQETNFKIKCERDNNQNIPKSEEMKSNVNWDNTLLEYFASQKTPDTAADSESQDKLKNARSVDDKRCNIQRNNNTIISKNEEKNDTAKVVPQVKLLCNQQELLKNGKITLFGKKAQTINFTQKGKQGSILLLMNGDAKIAELLKVDQNNVIIKGLKALPIVTVSDK